MKPETLAWLHGRFEPEQHKVVRKGGAEITHVAVWDYVDRLNEICPDWSLEGPVVFDSGGKLVIGVGLTIEGVTRWNFGSEDDTKDDYGSAATNAFAQAFKRACALFGLGRYLYDKDNAALAASQARAQRVLEIQPMTDNQRTKIWELLKTHVLTDEEKKQAVAYLQNNNTKVAAAKLLDRLLELIPERKAAEIEEGAEEGESLLEQAKRAWDLKEE